MVRPTIAGADPSADHQPAARRDPARVHRRVSALPAGLAAGGHGASGGGTGRRRGGARTAGWLRIARRGMGTGGTGAAGQGLLPAMAGPALFYRADWLGPLDSAPKPEDARVHPAAIESGGALRPGAPCSLAGVVAGGRAVRISARNGRGMARPFAGGGVVLQ